MGFLDKAKAAANDLAAKADTALSQASSSWTGGGDADRLLRDLGLLSWREQHGQPVDPADLTRVREALQALEQEGRLTGLQLQTTPAPPPPGNFSAPPPPGGTQAPPPPGGAQAEPYAAGPGEAPPSGPAGPAPSSPGHPGPNRTGPSTGGSTPPPPPPPPGF